MCTVGHKMRTIVSLLHELAEQNVMGLVGPQGVDYLRPQLPEFGQITQDFVWLQKECHISPGAQRRGNSYYFGAAQDDCGW